MDRFGVGLFGCGLTDDIAGAVDAATWLPRRNVHRGSAFFQIANSGSAADGGCNFMGRDIFRLFTIMLVALSMGMAFCHLMEMPVRLAYDPALWSQVTNVEGTYRYFGAPVGATIEGAAWLSALILAILLRGRKAEFLAATAGAIFMIAAHAIWWGFVFPVNSEMVEWRPDSLPSDFDALRAQWEYAHAARACLQIVALGLIATSATVFRNRAERGR